MLVVSSLPLPIFWTFWPKWQLWPCNLKTMLKLCYSVMKFSHLKLYFHLSFLSFLGSMYSLSRAEANERGIFPAGEGGGKSKNMDFLF